MRNGERAFVVGFAPDGIKTNYPVVGCRKTGEALALTIEGQYSLHHETEFDLIKEYVEPLEPVEFDAHIYNVNGMMMLTALPDEIEPFIGKKVIVTVREKDAGNRTG